MMTGAEQYGCRVAFIGAGYMAREHARAFADIPGVILSGIYSRTKARAESLAADYSFEGGYCDSIATLFERTKAQLVVIAVPELSVKEVCLEAFKYSWTCLVEKPVGYNLTDAGLIYEAATATNANVLVALNRRHFSVTRKVIEEISQSNEPRLVHVFDQEHPIQALAGGQPPLVVENWMYANSVHMVDYLSILGRGKIVSVEPVVAWTPADPSFVVSKITYDSGDIGIYEAVWNAPGPWAVTITTKTRRWELRPLEQLTTQLNGSRKTETLSADTWDTRFKPGLRFQAEEAVKAALHQPNASVTLDDAMQSMKLISQIYLS